MISGIKEKSIIVGYFYKYTHATYDWFCAPGSQMSFESKTKILNLNKVKM